MLGSSTWAGTRFAHDFASTNWSSWQGGLIIANRADFSAVAISRVAGAHGSGPVVMVGDPAPSMFDPERDSNSVAFDLSTRGFVTVRVCSPLAA